MNNFEEHIQTPNDLHEWLMQASKGTKATKTLQAGIYVSSNIRKQVLLSYDAGKIIINGRVKRVEFQDMKGGVWRAFVTLEASEDATVQDAIDTFNSKFLPEYEVIATHSNYSKIGCQLNVVDENKHVVWACKSVEALNAFNKNKIQMDTK